MKIKNAPNHMAKHLEYQSNLHLLHNIIKNRAKLHMLCHCSMHIVFFFQKKIGIYYIQFDVMTAQADLHRFTTISWCSALTGQPRPQGLLLVQNGRSEKPLNTWPKLLKYSTNHGVFCHVTHDEMAFLEVVSHVWRPCLFSAIGNRYSNKTKTFHRLCVTNF